MNSLRKDFPFLNQSKSRIYFDNAATSLKPQVMISAMEDYYINLSANVGRGDYKEAVLTTKKYEEIREKIADFLSVDNQEVVFTSGTTEGLNLIAQGFLKPQVKTGDVLLLSRQEHASNVLPWLALAQEKGLLVEFIDVQGRIGLEDIKKAYHPKVKYLALSHVSNVFGTINPIKEITEFAQSKNIITIVDGAQALGHFPINLTDLNVDFYVFSAHKVFGPNGLGILYGRKEHLEKMLPLIYGGGSNVDFSIDQEFILKRPPFRFESGTPNIAAVLAFGEVLEYINSVGLKTIETRNKELRDYLFEQSSQLSHLICLNPESDLPILSFNIEGIFSQDVAAYLASFNIAVRAGDHCAKMISFGKSQSSVRVSLHFYNTFEEIDYFIEKIKEITIEKCIALYA